MNQLIIDNIKNKLDDQKLSYELDNIKKIYNENYILIYDYQWFNGAIFNNFHTDLYNKNSIEIIFNSINGYNKNLVESLKNENHLLIMLNSQENIKNYYCQCKCGCKTKIMKDFVLCGDCADDFHNNKKN